MMKEVIDKLIKYIKNKKIKYGKNTIINTLKIGKNFCIGKNCIIAKGVTIGNNVSIGDCTYISSYTTIDTNVNIGKYCSIAKNVFIAPGVHKTNYLTTHPILFNKYWRKKIGVEEKDNYDTKIGKENEETYIGNDVWIALNAIIMRGVKIGDGAVIGAGAIVTKDVEPYSIVVGAPAKHIRFRFENEYIEKLQEVQKKWWDFSKEELNNNMQYMYNIEDYIDYNKL